MIRIPVLLLGVMLLWLKEANSQSGYKLAIHWVDAAPTGIKYPTSFSDSNRAANYLPLLTQQMQQKGFMNVSIDSVYASGSILEAWIYSGKQYKWVDVQPTDSSLVRMQTAGLNVPEFRTKNSSVAFDREQWLDYFANNGYPFAQLKLNNIAINEDAGTLAAQLYVDPGTLYKVDSIEQLGPVRLKPYFLYRYLNLPKGSLYNSSQLARVDVALAGLSFARLRSPSEVQMLATGSVLRVNMESRKSNIINVLLGAMPNSSQTPDNKIQITGDVNLQLRNSFGNGELMGFSWQQIQYKSPRIVLQYEQPYLFQSRFGLSVYFELFRKDSQFLNLRYRAGIPLQLSASRKAHIYFTGLSTTVSNTDTLAVLASYKLPDLANLSVNQLEFRLDDDATDYPLNPRKGFKYGIMAAGGLKRIAPDNSIIDLKDPNNPDFNFATLYDTVNTNTYQWRLSGELSKFFPLATASTLMLRAKVAWLQSSNYYRNELFQIGGFQLLRGFDEESIFSRAYAVGTAEYRILTGSNGYFYGFTDVAWSQLPNGNSLVNQSFWGLGLGLRAEANNTLINVAVAAGKQNAETFDLRRTKIHLGIINFF